MINEQRDSWYRQLDQIRQLAENAAEEYGQYLDEFETTHGTAERETYEEKYV